MNENETPANHDECACSEGRRAANAVTRRTLLAGASALGVVGVTSGLLDPDSATQYAFAADYTGDTVVVLSLRGGFDGLSAVVPVGDPAYYAARPGIAVPKSRAIQLNTMFGLHPALAPLKPIYDQGRLAVVHAVGQPNPTRSHFKAMTEMEKAAPGSQLRTGWIDRMVGLTTPARPFAAVAAGAVAPPPAMAGPSPEVAIKSVDTFTLSWAGNATEVARWTTALKAMYAGAPNALAAPATATLNAVATTTRLKVAGYSPAPGARYPAGELGNALRDVARLVKARVGLRVATIDTGDWDMHVGMGTSDKGWMFTKLSELGQALAAFHTDLGTAMNGVTLVTLSEFGRRVSQNASGGLDHGHGNVCLLMGGGVNGGKVYGRWPGLGADKLDAGDLAGTTDYRTILAEILEKRGRVATGTVFPQAAAARLGALRPR